MRRYIYRLWWYFFLLLMAWCIASFPISIIGRSVINALISYLPLSIVYIPIIYFFVKHYGFPLKTLGVKTEKMGNIVILIGMLINCVYFFVGRESLVVFGFLIVFSGVDWILSAREAKSITRRNFKTEYFGLKLCRYHSRLGFYLSLLLIVYGFKISPLIIVWKTLSSVLIFYFPLSILLIPITYYLVKYRGLREKMLGIDTEHVGSIVMLIGAFVTGFYWIVDQYFLLFFGFFIMLAGGDWVYSIREAKAVVSASSPANQQ